MSRDLPANLDNASNFDTGTSCNCCSICQCGGEKADFFTFGGVLQDLVSTVVTAFWVAQVSQLIQNAAGFTQEKSVFDGFDYISIGIGSFFGLFAAIGSAYCHFYLNKQNQRDAQQQQDDTVEEDAVVAARRNDNRGKKHAARISALQWVALAGDYLGHIGEAAGPIVLLIEIIWKLETVWPRPTESIQAIYHGAALTLGLYMAFTNARTCKNSLRNANTERWIQTGQNSCSPCCGPSAGYQTL